MLFVAITCLFIYSSFPTFFFEVINNEEILFVNKSNTRKLITRRLFWTGIASGNEHYDTVVTIQLFENIS